MASSAHRARVVTQRHGYGHKRNCRHVVSPQTHVYASRKVGEILVAMPVFGAKILSPNLQTPEDQSQYNVN
jgi:hypothetical protein